MKTKIKFFILITLLLVNHNLLAYEIIRDPIFENYFDNLSRDLKLNKLDVYLVENDSANAFVIKDNIYFTSGLFNIIDNEDTLKAIYLHEYAHVIKNHFEAKKIKIQQFENRSSFKTQQRRFFNKFLKWRVYVT